MNRIAEYFADTLEENGLFEFVRNLNRYVGDIHNHCGISYGYGTIESAIAFASTQLDFFSVTGHFAWPDISSNKEMHIPDEVVQYHIEGFKKLRREWPHYKECMKNAETKNLIPFSSYEYHSFEYGDYTVVCKELDEDLPNEIEDGSVDNRLRNLLTSNKTINNRFLPIPHHIGYKTGFRGINFDKYNANVSPLIEIISMHGAAESQESMNKYLHTMGPRCSDNTYQSGLKRRLHFGVSGSTDHHNASPGSYGFGRTVLWSKSLTRDSIWVALNDKQTSAASGDPIEAMLFVNGAFQGQKAKIDADSNVHIDCYVVGYDKLDRVELIQGDKVIYGKYEFIPSTSYSGCLPLMFGWGKKHKEAIWDIEIEVTNGILKYYSPRFRGVDMVDPLDVPESSDKYIPTIIRDKNKINLHFVTDGNINAVTNSTQGIVLDLYGNETTTINLSINVRWGSENISKGYSYSIDQLRDRNTSEYINGFVSPAIDIGPFRERDETLASICKDIEVDNDMAIYLRAYQKNGDCIFTSPVSFL